MPSFIDTNVLLYAVSVEQEDRGKRGAAVELLQSTDLALSAQVMAEAAKSLGCDTVLSEDLSDGQDYGGVRVENPFRGL